MGTVGFIGGKFLPLHQGHAYAITEAACRCDELYVVLSHSPVRDQKLCEAAGMKPIPYEVRLRWLSTLTRYLAKIYNTVFVEEYGRTIYEEMGGCDPILTKEYSPHIAYGHKLFTYESIV